LQNEVVAFKNPIEYKQRSPLVRPERRIWLEEWPTSPSFSASLETREKARMIKFTMEAA
jgi:hypothetical protein